MLMKQLTANELRQIQVALAARSRFLAQGLVLNQDGDIFELRKELDRTKSALKKVSSG
jgi:hypothetical protein